LSGPQLRFAEAKFKKHILQTLWYQKCYGIYASA
jgi:hypothetical protein